MPYAVVAEFLLYQDIANNRLLDFVKIFVTES